MTTAIAEFTKEEVAQRGKEIYERDIRHLVEAGNRGRVVAIDVHTGEYELADDALSSSLRLRARLPEAEIFVLRVGFPTLHRVLKMRIVRGGRVTLKSFLPTQPRKKRAI